MSATSEDWYRWLSRKSAAPAEWLQNLLEELDSYLQGAASQEDRDWVAAYLRRDKWLGLGCSDDQGLKAWPCQGTCVAPGPNSFSVASGRQRCGGSRSGACKSTSRR